ncbi:beta-xylosidase [Algibacter amylolyticus]|uniref:Beta-xylosidase n=1 Tax=Algibacter amylolyticus TaxID=1608400 RepID=A0A5M7BDE6_9FLAO|nr:beta-xylosidase [Algibacter amylolyticus]KAA5825155.1 beta-xylosidase [Algibacter amylolyticus]MBB5268736.1 xylan 1,4-beta-xylosidase [Algibacter amylolyticus]TSJ77649.1 beta-xylosidase [Algibacter amylolyticus]
MKTKFLLSIYLAFCLQIITINLNAQSNEAPISINIDFNKEVGEMNPIWGSWGYDEPNYTYMKDGKKLLSEIADLSAVPVYVRAHSLLVTHEGDIALKWGSTNAYTEDENGNPIYDWTVVDKIFDTYIERGMKPIAQIAFMPKALSSKPEPYRNDWISGAKYNRIFAGWSYPPNDYNKWAELIYQWVIHSVERYGKEEVESWYWELWNEPNIGYWQGTTEEYIKLYDYTADAVKRALPLAKIGGPETTGPGGKGAEKFLRAFLDHVVSGKNYVTGKTGSPLDFITFHAKGKPTMVDSLVQMNMGKQLRDISKGFEIVASYPTLKHLPIIIGESDPEGCAACSENDYPQNAYRNNTMYASYTAAAFARKYELADHFDVNLFSAVTWGFEFEDQPWFAGFRDMATNGVDKPVLNVFRMFGLMQGNRVKVSGNLEYDYLKLRDESVRGNPDVNAIAAKAKNASTIMVWNYHDNNNLNVPDAHVEIKVEGLPVGKVLLNHYRVDQEHSNSFTVWKGMGSPQDPTLEQISKLEKAGQLQLYTSPKWLTIEKGETTIKMKLPRQGISLFQFSY